MDGESSTAKVGCYIGAGIGMVMALAKGSVFLGAVLAVALGIVGGIIGGLIEKMTTKENPTDENSTDKKASIKNVRNICIAVLCFIIIAFLFVQCTSGGSRKNEYDNVFNKDPNTWTESEKNYVNNFFDWQNKQNK